MHTTRLSRNDNGTQCGSRHDHLGIVCWMRQLRRIQVTGQGLRIVWTIISRGWMVHETGQGPSTSSFALKDGGVTLQGRSNMKDELEGVHKFSYYEVIDVPRANEIRH